LRNWIKQVFTRTELDRKGKGKKLEKVEIPPSTRLLYTVYISMAMLASLIALQIVHLVVLKSWNSDVWTAIAGLIGTLTGLLLGAKA